MSAAYTAHLVRQFNRLLYLYGYTLTYKGTAYDCISRDIENSYETRPNNFREMSPCEFHIWKTDFVTSGIGIKSTLTAQGIVFEVEATYQHPPDPVVILRCMRKQ